MANTKMSIGDTGQVQSLVDMVADKVSKYDPTKDGEEASAYKETEEVGFWNLIFRYATGTDIMLWVLAMIATIITGASMPAFVLIFGEMIDSIGGAGGFGSLSDQALYMVYIGIVTMFVSGTQLFLFAWFADRIAHRIKIRYFEATLNMDSAFFDVQNPTEMAAKIAKETSSIQKGIGHKVGQVGMSVFSAIFGFAFAFYWGWLLTVILLGGVPAMAVAGGVMGVAAEGSQKEALVSYA